MSWKASLKERMIDPTKETPRQHHFEFLNKRAIGYWRKAAVVSWLVSGEVLSYKAHLLIQLLI